MTVDKYVVDSIAAYVLNQRRVGKTDVEIMTTLRSQNIVTCAANWGLMGRCPSEEEIAAAFAKAGVAPTKATVPSVTASTSTSKNWLILGGVAVAAWWFFFRKGK